MGVYAPRYTIRWLSPNSWPRGSAIQITIVAATVHPVRRTWIWMQVAIVVFVLAGMVIAITKLA